MKYLLRSVAGETTFLGMRLLAEGNQVRIAIKEPNYRRVGDGLVEKAADFENSVGWADVVVFDSNLHELPAEAEKIRASGKPVMGSGELAGKLELERMFGIEFARKAGMKVPPTPEKFRGPTAWQKAKQYLLTLRKEEGIVWKPDGDGPCSTYVAQGPNELFRMMAYWESLYKSHGDEPNFILTPKIDGEEISTEAWFNGKEFYLANQTLERNRFFNEDLGEKTGCAGNVVWLQQGKLYDTLLKPLAPMLAGKYFGPIDVNAIIEKRSNQPVFLEFTPRFGYDAIFALHELITSDIGRLLYDTAVGNVWDGGTSEAFAGAVRLHVPPYPESTEKNTEEKGRARGIPIFGWPGEYKRHLSPIEVMIDHTDKPVTSGPDGYVFVASAIGDTVEEAMDAAYRNVEKLRIPTARYRTDLATKLAEVYGNIDETGWIDTAKAEGVRPFSQLMRKRAW